MAVGTRLSGCWRPLGKRLFCLRAQGGSIRTISGADVADDSPSRAEKPLPDASFIVEVAEIEVRLVFGSSWLNRFLEVGLRGSLGESGTFRMSV